MVYVTKYGKAFHPQGKQPARDMLCYMQKILGGGGAQETSTQEDYASSPASGLDIHETAAMLPSTETPAISRD